jgi:crotonobetaine/carnitine-CoA ligase
VVARVTRPAHRWLDLSDPAERIFPKVLRRQAQENGATPFLLDDAQQISFAEADTITDRLASGMQALGVSAGDRIGIYMGNCSEFVLITLAANKLGAIWVPVSTDYRGEWLRDTLVRSRCRMLFADTERASRLGELDGQQLPETLVVLGEAGALESLDYRSLLDTPSVPLDFDSQHYGDTCAILWTSGTTGRSKGVMQNYNGWIRAITQGASPMFDSRPGDVIYCALPLFNTGAWITSVYRALLEGLPCVIEPRFSVSEFWSRIARFGATQTFLIGAMGVFLWNAPATPGDADTPLRKAMIVPFPPDLWRPFEERFGLEIITAGLGMSECQLIANQLRATVDLPPYALGYPPEDIDLRLCDDDGNEVPDGEVGEMCIRPLAPHVLFNGYFDNPEATATAFRGDYFLTGDMARKDPDTGALYFVDRKKDVVRFAGRNISTLEVESVFRRHPAVQDVAAFGIPAEEIASEDELKVNVVLKAGQTATAEDLCTFVADNAPHYFVPRYLEFVDSLPYTPTNKVQKYKLRSAGVNEATWDRQAAGFQVSR